MVSLAQQQFRLGAVIGRSFAVFFGNIVPFGILYLVVNAPSSIYAFTLAGQANADNDPGVRTLTFVEVFLGLVAAAAVTYATVQELRGRRVGFGEFFGRGLAQGGAAIRVAILSGILLLLAFIALVIPGLVLYTMWWVAIPVAVIERPGAVESLRRSAELTKGNRWRVFALVVGFLAGVFLVAIGIAFVIVVVVELSAAGDRTLFDQLMAVTMWVWTALFMAGQAVLTAVSYYYLRVAKEGVGIDEIATVFD
jgi:uncharacterized membrane protein